MSCIQCMNKEGHLVLTPDAAYCKISGFLSDKTEAREETTYMKDTQKKKVCFNRRADPIKYQSQGEAKS